MLPVSLVEILVIARSSSCSISLEHLVDAAARWYRPRPSHRPRRAGRRRGRCRSWSRRAIAASISSTSPPVSADAALGTHPRRRREVQLQLGVREHHRADVAALDHPAAVLDRPSAAGAARSSARTRLLAATALTAVVTSGVRMSRGDVDAVDEHPVVADLELDVVGELGDLGRRPPDRCRDAWRRSVTARYIAPVSRYSSPRRAASARATVLLPAPAGPSMAMTRTYQLVPCGRPSL